MGFVNTWWVFEEVAKEISYSIFMAEAEQIGYKRSKRGEKVTPNDLYRIAIDDNGIENILIDDGIKKAY